MINWICDECNAEEVMRRDNTRKVRLGDKEFEVINLTMPLTMDTEVYPGDPVPTKLVSFSTLRKNGGCLYNTYTLGDHVFRPHADAPNHQNVDMKSKGMEHWNMDYFFNKACLIERHQFGVHNITKQLVLDNLTLLKGCSAVVFRTGYDRVLEKNYKHGKKFIPYITHDAADMLAKLSNLKVIGIDSMTVDKSGENYVHKKLKHKMIVESLVNLRHIEYNTFDLQTSPVIIKGATGGPVIAYAYFEIKDHRKWIAIG